MYQTFRSAVNPAARPQVVILSARHGFLQEDSLVEPYDQRMTSERADYFLGNLTEHLAGEWPVTGVKNILLAGGKDYRRVMRAAICELVARGCVVQDAIVQETSGGIGYQRQQLGQFLRALAPAGTVVGHHANGTPLFQALGGFTVKQQVLLTYRSQPSLVARPAVIEELFEGPSGPTASVRVLDAKNAAAAHRWVCLKDLTPG